MKASPALPKKTALGVEEMRQRARGLSQRHRTMLLLVNGKRDRREVLALARQAGVEAALFDELVTMGLVDAGAAVAADAEADRRTMTVVTTDLVDLRDLVLAPVEPEAVAAADDDPAPPPRTEATEPAPRPAASAPAPTARRAAPPTAPQTAPQTAPTTAPPRGAPADVPSLSLSDSVSDDQLARLKRSSRGTARKADDGPAAPKAAPASSPVPAPAPTSASRRSSSATGTSSRSKPPASGSRASRSGGRSGAAPAPRPAAPATLTPVDPPAVRVRMAMAPPAAQSSAAEEERLLEEVRQLLIQALEIKGALMATLTAMRVRKARTRHELAELVWELERRLSKKHRGRVALEQIVRVRDLLGLGNTVVDDGPLTGFPDSRS